MASTRTYPQGGTMDQHSCRVVVENWGRAGSSTAAEGHAGQRHCQKI